MMNETLTRELAACAPRAELVPGAVMARYTTLRVGGPADLLIEATCGQDILRVSRYCREHGVPLLCVGNGSNLLVRDGGISGVVLHIGKAFSKITVDDTRMTAQAGALLSAAARAAMENGLSGLAFAAGIPGTVGGAALMNAGAYGGEMAQVIHSVRVVRNGEVIDIPREECDYGYRQSAMMERGDIVLEAAFSLARGSREDILDEMNALAARRREKQPLQYPSAGSFFKRPEGHFAGALIENAGLKGFSVGGAQVSALHAGFLINTGNASASDFLTLSRHIQDTVKARFGVMLEPEVRIAGREA